MLREQWLLIEPNGIEIELRSVLFFFFEDF